MKNLDLLVVMEKIPNWSTNQTLHVLDSFKHNHKRIRKWRTLIHLHRMKWRVVSLFLQHRSETTQSILEWYKNTKYDIWKRRAIYKVICLQIYTCTPRKEIVLFNNLHPCLTVNSCEGDDDHVISIITSQFEHVSINFECVWAPGMIDANSHPPPLIFLVYNELPLVYWWCLICMLRWGTRVCDDVVPSLMSPISSI